MPKFTINLPSDASVDTLICALWDSAHMSSKRGHDATAKRMTRIARYVDENNEYGPEAGKEDDKPTATGCDCDCAGRDSHEIPLYLTMDELHAVDQVMQRITFGDLTDDDDIVMIHRAAKEIRETGRRRLG